MHDLFRRILLLLAVVISTGTGLWPRQIPAAESPVPQGIVLLMGDDHGWDETGYYDHPHLHTPVLDEMAAVGLRLDRFYAAHPTCSPTRGSVMTGRHPNRYGTFTPNFSIRPEEITVAQLFANAGWRCGHFGKWHLGPVKVSSPTSPGAMGFHHWLSHDNFFELDPWLSQDGGPPQQFPGESSEIIVREALQFIENAVQADQPFFVVIWYGSPHEPYQGLPADLQRYAHVRQQFAPDDLVKLTSLETGTGTKRPRGEVLQERYAEITAMDRSVGQLRDWLRDHRLHDRTLLWYCGDNGTSRDGIVTSPFRGQKGNLYEGGVRVPGIIEWPAGLPAPRVSSIPAVTSDMLPTLCGLANIQLPDRPLDGLDLQPLLHNQWTQRPEPICFWSFAHRRESQNPPYLSVDDQTGTTPLVKQSGGKHTRTFRNFHHPTITEQDYLGSRVILGDQYKLVVNGQKMQLFDLQRDRQEDQDVIASKPQVVENLQHRLRTWQTSVLHSLTGADYR